MTDYYGTSGDDTLNAGNGNDRLYGGADNDQLDGGDGNDWLNAGFGDDVLVGGAGKDRLNDLAGNDCFVFNALTDTGLDSTTWDVISGFGRGSDKIDLSALDADTATPEDEAFTGFIESQTAFSAAGQFKVESRGSTATWMRNVQPI